MEEIKRCGECERTKHTPRSEEELKQLKNRLNRMIGQLNGIGRMLDENRYCGDILTQIAAVESALQSMGYIILKEHMETCQECKVLYEKLLHNFRVIVKSNLLFGRFIFYIVREHNTTTFINRNISSVICGL